MSRETEITNLGLKDKSAHSRHFVEFHNDYTEPNKKIIESNTSPLDQRQHLYKNAHSNNFDYNNTTETVIITANMINTGISPTDKTEHNVSGETNPSSNINEVSDYTYHHEEIANMPAKRKRNTEHVSTHENNITSFYKHKHDEQEQNTDAEKSNNLFNSFVHKNNRGMRSQSNKNALLRVQITNALSDQHKRYVNMLEEREQIIHKMHNAHSLEEQNSLEPFHLENKRKNMNKNKKAKHERVSTEPVTVSAIENNDGDDNNTKVEIVTNNVTQNSVIKEECPNRATFINSTFDNLWEEAEIEEKLIREWKRLMILNETSPYTNYYFNQKNFNSNNNHDSVNGENIQHNYLNCLETREALHLIEQHYVQCPSYIAMSANATRTEEGFVRSLSKFHNNERLEKANDISYHSPQSTSSLQTSCRLLLLREHSCCTQPRLHCTKLHLCSVCQLYAKYRCTRCKSALFCSDECFNIHQATRCLKYIVELTLLK